MFDSIGSILGFLLGVALTLGMLLSPHLVPGGWGYAAALQWPAWLIAAVLAGGLGVLAAVLWGAGRMIRGAGSWKEARVILAAVLIAGIANTLFMFLVELFGLKSGLRALVAVLGVPVIYGNLLAVLNKTSLKESMLNVFTGALSTLGAGFILAAIIRVW